MRQQVQCLHDLIISRELAFKKGVWYILEDNCILHGCNGQRRYVSTLPVSDPCLYFNFSDTRPLEEDKEDKESGVEKETFDSVLERMLAIYKAKNHDYGNSFDLSLDEFGMVAALTRMNDKLNRLKVLSRTDAKVGEAMGDTLLDLANYSVMSLVWLRNHSCHAKLKSQN